jgi:RNA polymerase sigma factor (sigma-70 family)
MTAVITQQQDEQQLVADLVRGAARGDDRCWSELVERYKKLVWSIARSFNLGDADAADVAQTTWLRLAEHVDRIEHPERVGAWLATTTRRECMRVKRLSGRTVPTEEIEELHLDDAAGPPPADNRIMTDARDQQLWNAFAGLPEHQRTLLLLLVADPPLSYKEISETLNIPIGSIGPTRARTLVGLRRRVEAVGITSAD